jgi:hypothetical protein
MKTLTRDEILGAEDLKSETVEVPEWGGAVIVRELTGSERDTWEASVVKTNGTKVTIDSHNMRAKLAALCIVDGDGKRMFTDKEAVALGSKSAAALDRVTDVARRLSRIGEDEIETLGKDSKPIKSGDSVST